MREETRTEDTQLLTPEGPGSVSGAPHLPEGFTHTFTSHYIQAGDVRLHAVIGGDGPPLLLIHGWPGSWYYWRLVMPALARDFEVIAVDQRGIGLSDMPEDGYDTGTLANDLIGLMDSLGHQRFAVVGVDTGMLIGYALAADHPDRVVRLAVGEAPLPGGLLVARVGKGNYIYTSMVWYRQLQAGVPGAYRMFANMISYGHRQG